MVQESEETPILAPTPNSSGGSPSPNDVEISQTEDLKETFVREEEKKKSPFYAITCMSSFVLIYLYPFKKGRVMASITLYRFINMDFVIVQKYSQNDGIYFGALTYSISLSISVDILLDCDFYHLRHCEHHFVVQVVLRVLVYQ